MMEESFSFQDVLEAEKRIKNHILESPLDPSLFLNEDTREYYFKLECYQTVRSFKIRGALNKMMTLTDEERKHGVATVSSGNHGASVSYAAKLLHIQPAWVIVPETTPESKVERIEFFGAKAVKSGKDYDEAHALGMKFVHDNALTYIDPYYEDSKIYAGQGTIGLEILRQNPEIDTILVPIGGGGLITGISVAAKAIKPSIRVIGVQTEACPAMLRAMEDKVFYEDYPTQESLCDALLGGVGKRSYEMARECIDDILIVSERKIKEATAYAIRREKILIEPSSATTIAAVWEHRSRIAGQKIALVLSGGNISEELLQNIVS